MAFVWFYLLLYIINNLGGHLKNRRCPLFLLSLKAVQDFLIGKCKSSIMVELSSLAKCIRVSREELNGRRCCEAAFELLPEFCNTFPWKKITLPYTELLSEKITWAEFCPFMP